jgi:glycosyltransferase involved in cell wall biosynthesis
MSDAPKHILIYTDDPDKGGVAQYNHSLAIGLVAAGYRVSFVQTESKAWRAVEQASRGIVHYWIGYDTNKEFVRTLTDTSDAEKAFAAAKPDLVLFSDCCPVSNIAARHIAMKMSIPFVIITHFVAPYLAERFKNCLPVLAGQYGRTSEVIAVSTENLEQLRRLFGLPAGRGTVVFNGVPEKYFAARDDAKRIEVRQRHGIPLDAIVSVTTARLTQVKGHIFQLHAMQLLCTKNPEVPLVCVWAGDGELEEPLKAEIKKMNLQDRFYLVGQQAKVEELYDAADIFTLTSSSEGMPISIMEAMAKGLPVAATGVSGIPEEIEGAGVILPDPQKDAPGVVMQLAKAWMEWARKPASRKTTGDLGRVRAGKLFKIDMCLQNTRKILDGGLFCNQEKHPDGRWY